MTGVSQSFCDNKLIKRKGAVEFMKTWNQLFIRHGWDLVEIEENSFDCSEESEGNMQFLIESLAKGEISYVQNNNKLTLSTPPVSEAKWIEIVDIKYRGRTEMVGVIDPNINTLDTYIAGVVRQLNKLGFTTEYSCDGHEKKSPLICFTKNIDTDLIHNYLICCGIAKFRMTENKHRYNLTLNIKREYLLELAESLSKVRTYGDKPFINKQLFLQTLEEYLMAQGESKNEARIREIVLNNLKMYVDKVVVDEAGNILAEKKYGYGSGPTILLNAHLDIVEAIREGRVIIKENNVWTSSQGILGADDRAGVAVVLEVLKELQFGIFKGKVKVALTVEEECGLIGARNVNEKFLSDIDAAIVVDRRGSGDIVTSCRGVIPFCHPAYGKFIETVAKDANLSGWTTTAGGMSDTKIWADNGIQSVNLYE